MISTRGISFLLSGRKEHSFYIHRCREQEQVYLQRFEALKQKNEFVGADWRGLKFVRGTIRETEDSKKIAVGFAEKVISCCTT